MNQQTMDVLGYGTILEEIASYAKTNLGKQTIAALRPMHDKRRIEQSLQEIAEGIKIAEKSSSVPIHTVDDMLLYIKQGKKGLFIRADQFMFVLSFLEHCIKLQNFMKDKQHIAPNVSMYAQSIPDVRILAEEIARCVRHGMVDDYATSDLAYLRRQLSILGDRLKEKANQLVKSKRYQAFLQDTVVSERNGRFTLAVKKEYRTKIQGAILDTSASGATVFMEPAELFAIQEDINMIKMAEEKEAERILYELTNKLLEHEYAINIAIETMHHYDVLFAKAQYSRKIKANIPEITEDFTINLKEARHPMLGKKAVPLSIAFGEEHRALVITGPNTGGKTVTLKTIGLITMMAASGLPIPAEAGSKLALFQHIFVDIGDGQNIEENLSTFSSRLVNIIAILQEANDRSLVLLDELGSGTDPGEGMALAIVILEQLSKKGATLFATTHYNEMKEFADKTPGFLNGTMEFDVKTLKPTYKLLLGQSGRSQAFAIASQLGLHPLLIEKAHLLAYKSYQSYKKEQNLHTSAFEKQIAINKYADASRRKVHQQTVPQQVLEQGDNVILTETNETGIIYKGPDAQGNYLVQVREEKRKINHKRLKLFIKAKELYPADYDFDIIFQSKEHRKISKQQKRKYIEEAWIEEE